MIASLQAKFEQPGVPVHFLQIHDQADGQCPNGIPNPLWTENRAATADAAKAHEAYLGIAWDGDFDRCFLFDENGEFGEGYYIVGLLAEAFLAKHPGEKIIHDPRLTWNTIDLVGRAAGIPIQCKTGHTFIKERMRRENAIYGGEMSAHHYFREFAYCDSGMIPWLLVTELLSRSGQPLSAMLGERIGPSRAAVKSTIKSMMLRPCWSVCASEQPQSDSTDGTSLELANWRLNLRSSNTKLLLRLNVESKGDAPAVAQRVAQLEHLILSHESNLSLGEAL